MRVIVYTDSHLDYQDGKLQQRAAEGRQLLSEAGAEVRVAKSIHDKALAIDGRVLVEGSFNWLSAVRTVGSIHQNYEASRYIYGEEAERDILRLREEMDYRCRLLEESMPEPEEAE